MKIIGYSYRAASFKVIQLILQTNHFIILDIAGSQ